MNNYYVYFHINPVKNKIFYVGMGSGNRAYKYGRNPHWESTVKKYGWIVDIVEEGLTEQEAKEREKFYIKKIGREILTNMTDGGDGTSGLEPWNKGQKGLQVAWNKDKKYKLNTIRSKEYRKKISELHKDKILSSETKKKISESKKGKFIGEKNPFYGKTHSEEIRKKISESKKGKSSPNAKKIINTETGEIYKSGREVSNIFKINYKTFNQYLTGKIKNKTPFQYYNPSN